MFISIQFMDKNAGE